MNTHADIWIIAGPPGAGKSTVANALLSRVKPTPALLDKDILYSRFVEAILSEAKRPTGEREGTWYDEHIKIYEYAGMTDVAREISTHGCPVILSAPFTKQIHNPSMWNTWVNELGGQPVRLIWVKSDAETLKHNLLARNLERDSMKLAHFDDFIQYMQPNKEPAVEHITIDNRLSAEKSINEQLQEALPRL